MSEKKRDCQIKFISNQDSQKKYKDEDGRKHADHFGRLFDSTAHHPKFKQLTATSRCVYTLMTIRSTGGLSFKFPLSAVTGYGISENAFRASVKQLEKYGFIKVQRYRTCPNVYSLSGDWKK